MRLPEQGKSILHKVDSIQVHCFTLRGNLIGKIFIHIV